MKSELCQSVGNHVCIEPDFICELGCNITFGNNVFLNFGCIIFDMGEVTIGDDSIINAGSVVTKDIPSGMITAESHTDGPTLELFILFPPREAFRSYSPR